MVIVLQQFFRPISFDPRVYFLLLKASSVPEADLMKHFSKALTGIQANNRCVILSDYQASG
jgi:hypothetical protein